MLALYNRRGVAWLLCVAFILMASVSGASWQCPDGHACPPGCTMQHGGEKANGASSPHACCMPQNSRNPGAAHCPLCSTASAANTQIKERCTSPICVLHVKAKPPINTRAQVHFVLDTTTILLPASSRVVAPEETRSLSFGSSRAPPDRVVVRLSSPRAPPV